MIKQALKLQNFFSEKKLIFLVVLVSILVRLLYLPVPFVINVADGAGYVAMADLAIGGNWQSFLDDYTYRTPFYPFFIAFSKIIFGRGFVIGLPWIQHALGVIMAVLVFAIGKKVFNKWVGFLAGILTGLNAYQVYWEHNSMSDFFFSFMAVLAFYLLLQALLSGRNKDYVAFGVVFGLNLLTRPLFQLFFVVFPVLIYLFTQDFRETLKRFAFIMIPVILVIAPWFWQNWIRHHYFGFTPFLGVQLMVRTQKYIDFASPLRAKEKTVYRQTMIDSGHTGQVAVAGWADLQRKLGYTSTQANQALQEIAFEAIKKNPQRYFRETFGEMNVLMTNHPKEVFFADIDLDPSFRQRYYQKIIEKDSWTIFHQELNWNLTLKMINFALLAIPGALAVLFKRNFKALIFLLVALYILLVTSAVEEGVVTRYRIPLDPYIFLFAAYSINMFFDLIKTINRKYEECLSKE